MTPLRQRMLEDMSIRNLAENTQQSYLQQVSSYARYFGCPPDTMGPEKVREYQVHLVEDCKLAPGSVSIAVSALRFLYKVTLKRPWSSDDIPMPKKPFKLPVILSPEEVMRFLDSVPQHEAPGHSDGGICSRIAGVRGHASEGHRHRQPADDASGRSGQGAEGPLRDALAPAAARSCASYWRAGRPEDVAVSRRHPRPSDFARCRGPGVPEGASVLPASTSRSRRIRCGMPLQPICWSAASTCAGSSC